jgi:hypothetical protein
MSQTRKIPNHKSQIPNKFQVPNSNDPNKNNFSASSSFWHFGHWSLVLIWDLMFGAWDFSLACQSLAITTTRRFSCRPPCAVRRLSRAINTEIPFSYRPIPDTINHRFRGGFHG